GGGGGGPGVGGGGGGAEGGRAPGADAAGDAAQPRAPAQHGAGQRDGRDHLPAGAGVLRRAEIARRPRCAQRRAGARPVRRAHVEAEALARTQRNSRRPRLKASTCSTLAICAALGMPTYFAPGMCSPMYFVPGAAPSCSPVIASTGSLMSFRRAVVLSFLIASAQPRK